MAKRVRRTLRKGRQQRTKTAASSDDDKDNNVNLSSKEFFNDEIDDFIALTDKNVCGEIGGDAGSSDEGDEVLAFSESGDEMEADTEDEDMNFAPPSSRRFMAELKMDAMASDIESNGELDDSRHVKGWGKKKSTYYNADNATKDYRVRRDSGEGVAEMEEKEALMLQNTLMADLEDDDFGLGWFKTAEKSDGDIAKDDFLEPGKIKRDLSKLTGREKLEALCIESPELLAVIQDFKEYMTELHESLEPQLQLIKSKNAPPSLDADYLATKKMLILNYCTNISFYMILKATCSSVENHPVLKRLAAYQKLLKQLKHPSPNLDKGNDLQIKKVGPIHGESTLQPSVEMTSLRPKLRILENIEGKKEESETMSKLSDLMNSAVPKTGTKFRENGKKVELLDKVESMETRVGKDILTSGSEDDESQAFIVDGSTLDDEATDIATSKRQVSFEIVKNKGLTPHRKKEYRNPRVKHRQKYRKANIRRKGQIRQVRTEVQRYGGEISGVRRAVVRSVKFKN